MIYVLHDLIFFHKIVNCQIPTKLPNYVLKYSGASRLRNNRLDYECYVCNLEHSAYAKSKSPLVTNIILQNEEVCSKSHYSLKPKAEVNNDLFSTRAKPELKTWYYHALVSYVEMARAQSTNQFIGSITTVTRHVGVSILPQLLCHVASS